jgi:hypothetical protein
VVADPGIMRVPRISRVLVTVPARDRSELPPGATIE